MKKGRRAFAIFMAMVMALALLPTAAFAQDDGALDNEETLGAEIVTETVGAAAAQESAEPDTTEVTDESFGGFAPDEGFGGFEVDDSFGGFADDDFAVWDDESDLADDILNAGIELYAASMCGYTAKWMEITGKGSKPIGGKFQDLRGEEPAFYNESTGSNTDLTDGGNYRVVGYKVEWKDASGKTQSSSELKLPNRPSATITVYVIAIDGTNPGASILLDVRFVDENDEPLDMPSDYAISYSGTIKSFSGDGYSFEDSGELTAEKLAYQGYPGCESQITFGEQAGLEIEGYRYVATDAAKFESTDYTTVYEEPFGSGNYVIDRYAIYMYGASVTIVNRYENVAPHTVSFEGIEETQQVAHSGKAVEPATDPTKEGYRFDGWDFDFDTLITEDTQVAAKWIKQVTHTWVSEGEIFSTTVEDEGAEATPPSDMPVRVGYDFDGWQDGEPDADGNVIHTAKWIIKQFTVTWMDGETEIATTEVDYGTTATAPEVTIPEGYRFGGWMSGENEFDLATAVTEDIVLSAKWIKQVTHVWMNGEEEVDSKTADEGAEVETPEAPTRSGYTFNGWSETTDEWGNVTYTAQWTRNSTGGPTGGGNTGGNTGGGNTGGNTGGDNTGDNTGDDNTGGNEGDDPVDPNNPNGEGENGGLVEIDDEDIALGDRPFAFIDVTKNDWFYDAVYAVWEKELMNGATATTFEPYTMTTRGMLVTILYRMEGCPEVVEPNSFGDVAADMYYAKAVAWAAANEIVTGYDENTFGPEDVLLREQTAAILYRYAKYKGMDLTAEGELKFDDADLISDYARDAMLWAVNVGLMNGMNESTLAPQEGTQRSHMATLLTRLVAMTEKVEGGEGEGESTEA